MGRRQTAVMRSEVTRRLLTADDYHSMLAAGILGPDDRVELLDGEIYEDAPIASSQAGCVMRLDGWFSARVGSRALVSVHHPLALSPFSEPAPDLALLAPRASRYADRHPRPTEVLLLIEVAGSSYPYDRNVKLPLYAEAGIVEAWIVDLVRRAIEVFRDPARGTFRRAERVEPGGGISPLRLPDLELDVAELLG